MTSWFEGIALDDEDRRCLDCGAEVRDISGYCDGCIERRRLAVRSPQLSRPPEPLTARQNSQEPAIRAGISRSADEVDRSASLVSLKTPSSALIREPSLRSSSAPTDGSARGQRPPMRRRPDTEGPGS